MSRWRQNVFQFSVNLGENREVLDDKKLFNELFEDLIHREWIIGDNDYLENFCEKWGTILVKPLNGSGGKGIYKLNYAGLEELERHEKLQELNSENLIIEQVLEQRGLLHEFNPSSVNTMRVNTLLDEGEAIVLNAFLRVGRKGQITDNFHAGGTLWQIELKTGEIRFGTTVEGNTVYDNPDTGERITGEKLPCFDKALEMCKEAQKRLPMIPQVGWDVVISDNYIALIEGNASSGFRNSDTDRYVWKELKKYLYKHQVKIRTTRNG